MIVAADKTIILMIEHKHVFFDLIDYLDETGGSDEIPIVLYNARARKILDEISSGANNNGKDGNDTTRTKLAAALEINNLERANLVIQVDPRRGVMVFAPFLLEMFRHFDNTRLRQLTSADLESLRISFNNSLTDMKPLVLQPGQDSFDDQLVLLRDRIRFAQSKMKENVRSLQGQADRLAQVVEDMSHENLEEVQQAQAAMDAINRIYIRHVLPTVQFLNEQEHIKSGLPALKALSLIAEDLSQAGQHDIAQQILYAVSSIRSYRHDVDVIRKSLERYVRQNEQQRRQYDSIESAFNALLLACRNLHDGKLKNNVLALTHEVFNRTPTFHGLKRQINPTRIEWHQVDHWRCLDEYLRVTLPALRTSVSSTVALDGKADAEAQAVRKSDARKALISLEVEHWNAPEHNDDAHNSLHQHLMAILPNYELDDLVEAFSWLGHRTDIELVPAYRCRSIEHEGYMLTYYSVIMERSAHVQ